MSSVTGIGVRSRPGGSAIDRARARLAAILAAASAALQLPLLRAGAALVLVAVCLESDADPGRVALSGCAGLLALSLALFRDPRDRLLFGVSAFALVVCYAWTSTELADIELWGRPSEALTPIVAMLRVLLRAWLVAMVLLASGVVLRGPSRLLTGSSDWLAPPFLGPALTGLLAVVAVATGSWIASGLVGRAPHDAASAVALFQARLLASGRLAAAAPALTEPFDAPLMLIRDGAWFGALPPGYPAILAAGLAAGAVWLVSPLAAGLSVLAVYGLGRSLFGGVAALVAALVLVQSPDFLWLAGSIDPDAVELLLMMCGLLLVECACRGDGWRTPLLAGLALGSLTAVSLPAATITIVCVVVWLASRRLGAGQSLRPFVPLVLGISWPIFGLLAYDRALTGDPLASPLGLWLLASGQSGGVAATAPAPTGLPAVLAGLQRLDQGLFGWPAHLALALAVLPFASGRARDGDWLCGSVVAGLLVAPLLLAHEAWGSRGWPFLAASGCFALLTARGVVCAADLTGQVVPSRLRRRSTPPTAALYLLLVLGLVGSTVSGVDPTVLSQRGQRVEADLGRSRLVERSDLQHALILVSGQFAKGGPDAAPLVARNDPDLGGPVFARDLGPAENARTMALFPDRLVYRLVDDRLVPVAR